MNTYVIGIDGGGSKTDGVCATMDGATVSTSSSGPTSLTATSLGVASMNLVETMRQLTATLPQEYVIGRIVIGVAGLDTLQEKERATQMFREVLSEYRVNGLRVVNDIQLILAAATVSGSTIALIAGTGSQCYGHHEDGRTAKTSGMDYLLADEGSGYEIGRLTLRAALSSFDGRRQRSTLEDLVLQHYAVSSFDELKGKIYTPPLPKAQVGELAKIWGVAYEQHDPAAIEIFDQIVRDQVEMVGGVVRRLELERTHAHVVCAGSIACLPSIFAAVSQKICSLYPEIEVTQLEKEPVYGAVSLALART